ncbi:hypothetical protein DERP_009798 [Dermatophagoides pteronyssinus]|uniref:Uncharacterized protein n=1 Tax=Dermatophagoides pteronyssinus TaxID=6956 RepID=A0ABQ8IR64_DERPT|nr:hypothetical protein DERP_009798 [Dermatophagoides pteronyssinus]
MTINVNIAVIILFMMIQTTLTNVWFPKSYTDDHLEQCGIEHDINGFSILDDHLHQFGKCSVIIYRPPLSEHLDQNFTQLKLDNGYMFEFFDMPRMNLLKNICSWSFASLIDPVYSLLRRKNNNNHQSNYKNNNHNNTSIFHTKNPYTKKNKGKNTSNIYLYLLETTEKINIFIK